MRKILMILAMMLCCIVAKGQEKQSIDTSLYYTNKMIFFKECDKYRLDNIYTTTNDTIQFPRKENSTIDTVTLISRLRIDEYGSIMKDCILVGDKEIIKEYLEYIRTF